MLLLSVVLPSWPKNSGGSAFSDDMAVYSDSVDSCVVSLAVCGAGDRVDDRVSMTDMSSLYLK